MFNVYFDSGTTNTRIYLVKSHQVIDFMKMSIGSKDSSISGSNDVLMNGLKQLYDEILQKNGLLDSDIDGIYASGMVTSPFGIKEVPHVSTPVSLEKLHSTIYTCHETDFFQRVIYLIRGVKTIPEEFKVDRHNISSVNNMRGEEIEIFGLLSTLADSWGNEDIAVFLPGSHTHVVYIHNQSVYDILSTLSGELFHAVATSTVLSRSINLNMDMLDEEMVLLGFDSLQKFGPNRALYLVNTMQVLSSLNNTEKTSFLEGVITGGVVQAFENKRDTGWGNVSRVVIVGNSKMTGVYKLLLSSVDKGIEIKVVESNEKESFALKGFLEILKLEEKQCQEKYLLLQDHSDKSVMNL